MKKVQRTLAAALAAMMLMALAGCSKGDVTKEVDSGLSDLKAQAVEPAVERSLLQSRSRKPPPNRPLLPLLQKIPIIRRLPA